MQGKAPTPRPVPLGPRDERDLLAAVCGFMSEAERRDFEARLAADPLLAHEFERRRAAWDGVVDPPEVRLPWGFGRRLAARASAERKAERELAGDWRSAPNWARLAAAAALVCGVACGWTLAPTLALPRAPGETAVAPVVLATQSAEVSSQVADPGVDAEAVADGGDLLGSEGLLDDGGPSLWEALASGEDMAGSS